MTYKIEYQKEVLGHLGGGQLTIIRFLVFSIGGWMLKDGNSKNIRKFDDIGSAMNWIDEERRGV